MRSRPKARMRTKAALIREAASDLLSLPWEIMHDGVGYLSQGANGVRVRRRLPNRKQRRPCKPNCRSGCCCSVRAPKLTTKADPVGYLDHRSSALPLVQAVENLGETWSRSISCIRPLFPP